MEKIDKKRKIKSTKNLPLSQIKFKFADDVNEFAENIVNTVREPLLMLDKELRIVKASRSFYEFFKITSDETIGKLIYDLRNQQWDIPKLRELLEIILPEKTSFDNYEVEHVFSTIGKRVILLDARQIAGSHGKEKIILLAIEDITEQKREEEALSKQGHMTSEYLDILLDRAQAPIIIWDSSMVIRHFNHQFEKLSGYNWTEVHDKKIEMLFPKDKITSTLELIKNNLEVENPEVIDVDILTKDKDIKTVLWNSTNIYNGERKKTVTTIALDITKRKRTEEALSISEIRYRHLFETAKDGIIILDSKTGKIVDVNPFVVELFGYSKELLIQKKIWEIGFFKDITANKNKFLEIQREEYVRFDNLFFESANGRKINVEFVSNTYSINHHKIIQCNIRDNTSRWRTEEALIKSEVKYRTLVTQSPDGIFIMYLSGAFLSVNKAMCDLLKYSEEEFLSSVKLWDLLPQKYLPIVKRNFASILEGEIPKKALEYEVIGKDGVVHFLAVRSVAYYKDTKIIGMQGIARNITEQKRAEESLKLFRTLIDRSNDSIELIDLETGCFVDCNEKAFKELGYTREEFLSLNLYTVAPDLTENNFPKRLESIRNLDSLLIEGIHRRKDGSEFPVEINMKYVKLERDYIIAVVRNITERKQVEQELISAKEKAEEMNRIKTNFLANMSHELRTPLIGILGYAEFLEEEIEDKELNRMVKIISESGKRLNKTLNNILDISKIESDRQQINIKKQDVLKYLAEQIKLFEIAADEKKLTLNFESSEEILNAYIDEELFVSIINNLLSNAIKYTNTGTIKVTAKLQEDKAVIEIKDTGIGVPQDLQEIIFDPFRQASEGFTRKFEGAGLGLTLVKKYTDLMGGTISLKSQPGYGSNFVLTLPVNQTIEENLIETNWV